MDFSSAALAKDGASKWRSTLEGFVNAWWCSLESCLLLHLHPEAQLEHTSQQYLVAARKQILSTQQRHALHKWWHTIRWQKDELDAWRHQVARSVANPARAARSALAARSPSSRLVARSGGPVPPMKLPDSGRTSLQRRRGVAKGLLHRRTSPEHPRTSERKARIAARSSALIVDKVNGVGRGGSIPSTSGAPALSEASPLMPAAATDCGAPGQDVASRVVTTVSQASLGRSTQQQRAPSAAQLALGYLCYGNAADVSGSDGLGVSGRAAWTALRSWRCLRKWRRVAMARRVRIEALRKAVLAMPLKVRALHTGLSTFKARAPYWDAEATAADSQLLFSPDAFWAATTLDQVRQAVHGRPIIRRGIYRFGFRIVGSGQGIVVGVSDASAVGTQHQPVGGCGWGLNLANGGPYAAGQSRLRAHACACARAWASV